MSLLELVTTKTVNSFVGTFLMVITQVAIDRKAMDDGQRLGG